MANTSTSSWYNASNGGSTTLDTEAISGAGEKIRILNAEIQWEGKEENYTYTTIQDTNKRTSLHPTRNDYVDTNSDSATSSTTSKSELNHFGYSGTVSFTLEDIQSEYNVAGDVSLQMHLEVDKPVGNSVDVEYERPDGSTGTSTVKSDVGGLTKSFGDITLGSNAGETRTATILNDSVDATVQYEVKYVWEEKDTITASTTVPSGTGSSIDYTKLEVKIEDTTGNTPRDDISYSYSVGTDQGIIYATLDPADTQSPDTEGDYINNEISITTTAQGVKLSANTKTYSYSLSDNQSTYTIDNSGDFFDVEFILEIENWDSNKSMDYDIDWSTPVESGNTSGTLSGNDSSKDIVNKYYSDNDLTQDQIDNGVFEITANTAHQDMEIDIYVDTDYEVEKTGTRYTQDPSVSGDASGSTGATLTQGELSNWQNLSGLASGNNTLNHSIDDMGEAKFRIKFEWDYSFPDKAHGMVGFYDESSNEWKECIVADSSDSKLKYDHITVYNPSTGSWGVLDVVDASENTAIKSHQFYDPDAGWVAPREFSTAAN